MNIESFYFNNILDRKRIYSSRYDILIIKYLNPFKYSVLNLLYIMNTSTIQNRDTFFIGSILRVEQLYYVKSISNF